MARTKQRLLMCMAEKDSVLLFESPTPIYVSYTIYKLELLKKWGGEKIWWGLEKVTGFTFWSYLGFWKLLFLYGFQCLKTGFQDQWPPLSLLSPLHALVIPPVQELRNITWITGLGIKISTTCLSKSERIAEYQSQTCWPTFS